MNRKTIGRLGIALPLVVSCIVIVLASCGKNNTTSTVSVLPTAFTLLRYGANGAPDTTFGGGDGAVITDFENTLNDFALAVALQPDLKIVVAGSSGRTTAPNTFQGLMAVLRYKPDGTLDSAFGTGGSVRTPVNATDSAEANAVAVQADGNIVVVGTILAPDFSGKGIALVRYKPDGTLDTGFGTPGTGIVTKTIGTGDDTVASAIALQPALLPANVKIIVAGHAFTGTNTDIVLLRYNLDGTPDLTFGTGGLVITSLGADAAALGVQLQSTGKIVVAGSVGSFSDFSMDAVLLRYNTDGTLDTTFGTGGTGKVFTDILSGNNFSNAIAVQTGDKIVVVGHANVNFDADTSDIAVLRYNPDGTPDGTFGGPLGAVVTDLGAFDNVFSVAVQSDGKIVISGNTGSAGSGTRVVVLRYRVDGTLDPAFGPPLPGGLVITAATGPSTIASGNVVLVQPDGGIVVAGYD